MLQCLVEAACEGPHRETPGHNPPLPPALVGFYHPWGVVITDFSMRGFLCPVYFGGVWLPWGAITPLGRLVPRFIMDHTPVCDSGHCFVHSCTPYGTR